MIEYTKDIRRAIMPFTDFILLEPHRITNRKDCEVVCRVDGKGEGSYSTRTEYFLKAIEHLETFTVEQRDNTLIITHDKGEMMIPSFPFHPEPVKHEPTAWIEGYFADAVKRVKSVVQPDDMRPNLSGICLDALDGECNVVGTDAMSLYVETVTCEGSGLVVLPREAWNLLEGRARIGIGKTIVIQTEHLEAFIPHITLSYALYKPLLTAKGSVTWVGGRNALIKALKRARNFTNPTLRGIKFTLGNSRLKIEGQDADMEYSFVEQIDGITNGDMVVGLNADRAIAALMSEEGDTVTLHFASPDRATFVGNRLVMPLSI